MSVYSKFIAISARYPIVRAMISYGTMWPISNVIQQTAEGTKWDNLDWGLVVRFGGYGAFVQAPLLYSWVRRSSKLFANYPNTVKTAVTKVCIEMSIYAPIAYILFFFGISLLKGYSYEKACEEVRTKFWPTYMSSLCFWPFVQTINYAFIPERNRVPFTSLFSLLWCCFLSYMAQLKRGKDI